MSSGHSLSPSELSQTATSLSLLYLARARDDAAWQRLVAIYSPLIQHWCRQAGITPEDAQDVAQETFGVVFRGLATLQLGGNGNSFRGWLRTIVRNRLIDLYRAHAVKVQASGGTESQLRLAQISNPLTDATVTEDSTETGLVFRAAMNIIQMEFESATAQAFWRTTVEERLPTDVAAELGLSVNAVYKAKSRVLRRLREMLAGLE